MKQLMDQKFRNGVSGSGTSSAEAKAAKAVKRIVKRLLRAALCLALCALCWSSVGHPAIAAASYTPLQQTQIQKFEASLQAAYDRVPELGSYVVAEDWTNIQNFLHGPLGEVRRYMASINRNRPPKEQRQARDRARALMGHIERLDAAAKDQNIRAVQQEYAGTLEDFERFLDSMPQF